MVETYKNKFNKKYGFAKDTSHSLEEISKLTGYNLKGLENIQSKGEGAYYSNPQSVRPHIKSPIEWGIARVYSAVMGGKSAKIDKWQLIIEGKGKNMTMYKLIDFDESNDNKHKYKITFQNLDTNRTKTIKFGAYGMGDYIYYYKTLGKVEADKHKDRYIKRHSGMGEDYENMLSRGALSMRILWNKPTLKESLIDFVKYFIKKKKLII